jgi:phosphatidylethanolamine/phosphatidyl-N-methylethanolamine N-methyltransferase
LGTVSKDNVVTTYGRWAPTYDATFGSISGRYHKHIGYFVRAQGARRVLEIGVGTGLSLRHYPAGTSVAGIDICPRMLAKAEERKSKGVAADVDLQLVDGEQLPFQDQVFDAVIMLFVISVTPDPERLLSEVFRVMKPQGTALIINHFAGVRGLAWLERLFEPLAKVVGFQSNLALRRVVKATPMRAISVQPLPPMGFFTMVHLQRP